MKKKRIDKCSICHGSKIAKVNADGVVHCSVCEQSGVQEPLNLTNDGNLEIVFIGVGSAFAKLHNQTNFLIIKGKTHVMVDFGMTGPAALWETARLSPVDIDTILPTHSHADHVGGIECLGLMNRYVGQRFMNKPKTKMIVTSEYQRILWDQSLRGGMEWNEDLETHGKGRKLSFTDFFQVIRPEWKASMPRETFEIDYEGIHIELFRTNHIPEQSSKWEDAFVSFGLMIDNRVFVSMDTQYDEELIRHYSPKSEVMFQDVQFFSGAVHAPMDDLKKFSSEIKQKMYLMHYADNWKEQNANDFAGWAEEGVRYIF